MPQSEPDSVSAALTARIHAAIRAEGGWLPFDRYMTLALYEPGLGYYAHTGRKFGWGPETGSDFVTAPELSPLFGRTLAVQVAQVLQATGCRDVFEFGAGSGALAEQLLDGLAEQGLGDVRYAIVDLSSSLRERQAQRLARFGERVRWLDTWPADMRGVVVGNEVLDAMPVKLLVRNDANTAWLERGVVSREGHLHWEDRPTEDRIPTDGVVLPGMLTEIHPHAEAFVRSLGDHLREGAAFFVDYGFPEAEYYLPQRHQGTLMCHEAHKSDPDPLERPGDKDITAHVNFTGVALAAQDAGLEVLGYTSQGRFLINCGIAQRMAEADTREQVMAQRLLQEHEMGELFKVLALATPGLELDPIGFLVGDRTHRL